MGCHGGGTGYNRAFCVESDVQLNNCFWVGTPKDCKQTCPSGMILLTQNTHIAGFKTGCKNGNFSSFCCESITANSLISCGRSNIDNLLTGGLGIQRKSVEEIQSQMAILTSQEVSIQTPPPSASRWNPASGTSIPLGPKETRDPHRYCFIPPSSQTLLFNIIYISILCSVYYKY